MTKKRGRGRPAMAESKKRSHRIAVNLTGSEYRELARAAKLAGVSPGRLLADSWLQGRKG